MNDFVKASLCLVLISLAALIGVVAKKIDAAPAPHARPACPCGPGCPCTPEEDE